MITMQLSRVQLITTVNQSIYINRVGKCPKATKSRKDIESFFFFFTYFDCHAIIVSNGF